VHVCGERVVLLKFTHCGAVIMLALRSTPICLMMSRRTSATVTFNITDRGPDGDAVDDLVGNRPPRREIAACCASIGLDYRAGQHQLFADAFRSGFRVRQRLLQCCAHAVEIALDRDVVRGDLLPAASKNTTLVWPTAER